MSDLSPDLRQPAPPPAPGAAAPWWLRLRRALVDGVARLRRRVGPGRQTPVGRAPASVADIDRARERHPGAPRPHGAWSQASLDIAPQGLDDQLLRANAAFHDGLTGLPNRQRFEHQLAGRSQAVREAHGQPFALLMLEVDRLPCLDEPLGDAEDEAFLVAAARRIEHSLRPADTVARLNGGRFAILAVDPDGGQGVIALTERVLAALQRPFQIGGMEVATRAHVGVALSGTGRPDAAQLLRDADAALARAQVAGAVREALADDAPCDPAPATERVGVLPRVDNLRCAPAADALQRTLKTALTLDYEPVFELASGRIIGFEARVRGQHAEPGPIDAQDLLPPADQAGLMAAATDQVLHTACHQFATWQALGGPFGALVLSVNLSGVDLADPALVARVQGALAESGLAPERLMLEVGEHTLMQGLDAALPVLGALREAGIALCLDGFGTGASSLRHLVKLPVSGLKIAPAFVADLVNGQTGESGHAIVHALVTMAESVAKSVAAEGIATAEQLERLQMAGCRAGQGAFLSRPLTAAQVVQLLDRLMDQPLSVAVAHRDTARAMFG